MRTLIFSNFIISRCRVLLYFSTPQFDDETKKFVELGQVPDARRMHSATKFFGVKENQRKYPVTFNRLPDNQKQQH